MQNMLARSAFALVALTTLLASAPGCASSASDASGDVTDDSSDALTAISTAQFQAAMSALATATSQRAPSREEREFATGQLTAASRDASDVQLGPWLADAGARTRDDDVLFVYQSSDGRESLLALREYVSPNTPNVISYLVSVTPSLREPSKTLFFAERDYVQRSGDRMTVSRRDYWALDRNKGVLTAVSGASGSGSGSTATTTNAKGPDTSEACTSCINDNAHWVSTAVYLGVGVASGFVIAVLCGQEIVATAAATLGLGAVAGVAVCNTTVALVIDAAAGWSIPDAPRYYCTFAQHACHL